ncbi:hypothetical protein BC827DRAFT_1217254, partial [Russula dissimulans]
MRSWATSKASFLPHPTRARSFHWRSPVPPLDLATPATLASTPLVSSRAIGGFNISSAIAHLS